MASRVSAATGGHHAGGRDDLRLRPGRQPHGLHAHQHARDHAHLRLGADRIKTAVQGSATTDSVNAAGNLVARGNDALSYDQAHRLVSAVVGDVTSTVPAHRPASRLQLPPC